MLVDEKLRRRAGTEVGARGRGEEKSVWNFFALFRRRWEFASFINSRYSRPSPLGTVTTTTTGSCDTFSRGMSRLLRVKDLNRVRLLKRKLMKNIFFVNRNQNYTWIKINYVMHNKRDSQDVRKVIRENLRSCYPSNDYFIPQSLLRSIPS